MRMACAVLFVLFTFCYLFFYQADILTVGQHILSGGGCAYHTGSDAFAGRYVWFDQVAKPVSCRNLSAFVRGTHLYYQREQAS